MGLELGWGLGWGWTRTGAGPAQEPVPSPAAPQLWVQDRLPLATQQDLGSNLQSVQQLIKKNQVRPAARPGGGGPTII